MSNSPYLAQVIGAYLVLMGSMMMINQKFFIHAMHDFLVSRPLRFVIPAIELIAGLALVFSHNVWVFGYEVIITLIGWLMIIESVWYLMSSEKKVVKKLSAYNQPEYYVMGGLLCITLGLYLAAKGFGLT